MAHRRSLLALALTAAALLAPTSASAATGLRLNGRGASADPRTASDALRLARRIQDGHGVETGRELSPVLRTLAVKLPQLHGAERRRAERMLARPTVGDSTSNDNRVYEVAEAKPVCGTHFCVHYVTSTQDAPPLTDAGGNGVPDYVEVALGEFEHVYDVENNKMGWKPAKSDGNAGGNDLVDVYLANIGPDGLFGYAAVDPGQRGRSRSAYLVLDNDYAEPAFADRGYTGSLAPLQVTAAHEYNHVLQYNYDTFMDSWSLEATATWMEDKVYDDINDYRQYLDVFAKRSQQPLTQFNSQDSGDTNDKVYGDAVFNRWIDEHYGQDTIRRVWEVAQSSDDFAAGAYDNALKEKGTGFFGVFTQFASDTAEWRSANTAFEEGGTFPDLTRALDGDAIYPEDATGDRSGSISGGLDHTGYALITIDPRGKSQLTVGATIRRGVGGAVALVGRTGDLNGGTYTSQVTRMPNGGAGKVTLDNASSYSRVTAVIINGDSTSTGVSGSTGERVYAFDREPISLAVNDFTTPGFRRQSPKPGAKRVSTRSRISIKANEPLAGVTTSSVKLLGPGNRSVGVGLRVSSDGRTVKLTPSRRLSRGRRYTVRLSSGVTDAAGNALPSSRRVWRFTTGR